MIVVHITKFVLDMIYDLFPKQVLGFTCLQLKSFENTVGKRRNCSLRAISPFPHIVFYHLKDFLPFSLNLKLSSENSFGLE